jgi:hypothetical protein
MINKRSSLVAVSIVCALIGTTYAQLSNATIRGTVSDPSGAVMPQARVELQNTQTNEQREKTASSEGFFLFPALLPVNIS